MVELYYSVTDTTASITGCNLYSDEDIIIPSIYNNKPVTSIKKGAFKYCELITSVTIPESITNIEEEAFQDCISLVSVNIPSSISNIPKNCFKGCVNLTNINLGNITTIGDYAFEECRLLNIELSENIESVGTCSFHHSGLTTLDVSANLLNMGYGAFSWCPLESINVNINNPNYCIEDNVIYNKDKTILILYPPFKSDTVFTIPETVTTISLHAFEENSYMETIRINDNMESVRVLYGLTNIKNFEFYNSTGAIPETQHGYKVLTNENTGKKYLYRNSTLIKVPVDETSTVGCPSFSAITYGTFDNCTKLEEIDLSLSYNLGYKTFYNCKNLVFPSIQALKINGYEIPSYCFSECDNITSLIINLRDNAPMLRISPYAFYNCDKMSYVKFEPSVENVYIYEHAFENCISLMECIYTFNSYVPTMYAMAKCQKNAFKNTAGSQNSLSYEMFNNEFLALFGEKVYIPETTDKTLWQLSKICNATRFSGTIILGDGMTRIPSYTFSKSAIDYQGWQFNKNTIRFEFPSTITTIGAYAFYQNDWESMFFDFSKCNNITSVESYAFYEVKNLDINLGNLKNAGNCAFYKTIFNNKININVNDTKSSVAYGSSAFGDSVGLENISVTCNAIVIGSNSKETIQYYNENGELILKSLSFNSTGGTFNGGLNNSQNSLKNNAKNISIVANYVVLSGSHLFAKNPNLESFHIKAENVDINSPSMCYMCYNLKDITVSGCVPQYAFDSCYRLKSVKFYKMQLNDAISRYGFYECHSIASLDFSESGLTEINMQKSDNYYYPFGYSKLFCLKNLILPENLTSLTIAGLGFKGKNFNLPNSLKSLTIDICPALSEIDIPKNVESITFVNNYSNYNHSIRKLKVPNGCAVNNAYYKKNNVQIPIKITYY